MSLNPYLCLLESILLHLLDDLFAFLLDHTTILLSSRVIPLILTTIEASETSLNLNTKIMDVM